jgi:flagellar hook-associated protein 2
MGTVTLSGFNNIDFGSILEALMKQERLPVTQLESQQTALRAQQSAFATFATKLDALQSAANDLQNASGFSGRAASISNPAALSASVGSATPIGIYEITVTELARAQVTGTTSTHTDKNTTTVASGGSLTIGGKTVTVGGNVTLQGLADAINTTDDIGVTASVVQNGSNFQLVLTGNETGAANAFTITNNLSGGSGVTFATTNAQSASDAAGKVNGIDFSSTTNTVEGAVPGATLNLSKKDPVNPIVLTITGDTSSVKSMVEKFVTNYNAVVKFLDDQQAAAGRKETTNIGRDPLVRGLRTQLSRTLLKDFEGDGTFSSLAQVGLSFTRSGQLEFNGSAFDKAISTDQASVQKLFTGDGVNKGLMQSFVNVVKDYTKADGLVPNAEQRLDDQLGKVADRIADMEARLEVRRLALQKEFTAADQAISQLNAAGNSLSSLSSQYRLF